MPSFSPDAFYVLECFLLKVAMSYIWPIGIEEVVLLVIMVSV